MAIKIVVSGGNGVVKPVSLAGKNLEQLRAVNALEAAPKIGVGNEGGRAVAKKVPAQIVQNGFLGALAFAIESVSGEKPVDDGFYGKNGYANTFVAIMKHLKSVGRDFGVCSEGLCGFIKGLGGKSAGELRAVTEESLAYLNYLRRFAKPGKDNQHAESEG